MTFAFKPAGGAWIEIAGDTLLPGFGEPDGDDVRHDVMVSEAFVASLSGAVRAARGLVAVVEPDRPVGMVITGQSIVDVNGVPTRQYQTANLSSPALAAAVQARKDAIDGHATALITALGPPWKQMDMICQAISLLDTQLNGTLSSDQVSARAALRSTLAWLLSVRTHAEVLKGQLPATGPELAAFDITTGWPSAPA